MPEKTLLLSCPKLSQCSTVATEVVKETLEELFFHNGVLDEEEEGNRSYSLLMDLLYDEFGEINPHLGVDEFFSFVKDEQTAILSFRKEIDHVLTRIRDHNVGSLEVLYNELENLQSLDDVKVQVGNNHVLLIIKGR